MSLLGRWEGKGRLGEAGPVGVKTQDDLNRIVPDGVLIPHRLRASNIATLPRDIRKAETS